MTSNTVSSSVSSFNGARFLWATLLIYPLWLLMVGSFDPAEMLVGVLVALLTAGLSQKHLHVLDDFKWHPLMPLYLLIYFGIFLWALLRANLDVAGRVLSPRLPINPAIVEVETQLQSDLAKLFLANSITLTPGTLTIDVIDQRLQVHWIDSAAGQDMQHATASIAAQFEYHLSKFMK